MGAAAKVDPAALIVELDRLARRNGVDELDLEVLALVAEEGLGFLARDLPLGEGFVARDDLAHLLLDRREILGREGLVARKIVIEAVLDHGPDGHLRARVELLHGFGEHMGRIVPDELQRTRIIACHELDLGIMGDLVGKVGEIAVERHGDGALQERRRNAFGNLGAADASFKLALGAIGKCKGDHRSLLAHSCTPCR